MSMTISSPEAFYSVIPTQYTQSRELLGTSLTGVFRDVQNLARFHAVPSVLSQRLYDPLRVMGIENPAFGVFHDRWLDTVDMTPVRRAYIANSYLGFMSEPMTYYKVHNRPGMEMIRRFYTSQDKPVYQALLRSGEMRQVNPKYISWKSADEPEIGKDWNITIGNSDPVGWDDIFARTLFRYAIDQYEEDPDRNIIYKSISGSYLDSFFSRSSDGYNFWFSFCKEYSAAFQNSRNSERSASATIRNLQKSGHDLSGLIERSGGTIRWLVDGPEAIQDVLQPESRLPGIIKALTSAWQSSHLDANYLVETELSTNSMEYLLLMFLNEIANKRIEGITTIDGDNEVRIKLEGNYPTFRLSPRLWNQTQVLNQNLYGL